MLNIHGIAAAVFEAQELVIEKDEAHSLAEGLANVARHYDIQATEKAVDWTNLIMLAATTYGSRAIAISIRLKSQREAAMPNQSEPRRAAEVVTPSQFAGPAGVVQ